MQGPAPDKTLAPALAAGLADFARSCKAAARAVSLYPGQHPAIALSLGRLVEATARMTASGPLYLEVRPDTLLIGGARSPKDDAAVTELADLLHRHLIGALTVNAGIDAASWRTVLLLLARTPDEVRADGGIAHLWATAGGPSLEIREIDYAEVLREKRGTDTSLDAIIAAALDGAQLQLDDETIDRLLAILGDPEQLDALMAQLEHAAKERGADARATAVIKMMQSIVTRAKEKDPGELEGSLRQLGRVASRLSADDMLRLLAQRDAHAEGGDAVGAVLDQLGDGDVAKFVAGSVIAEHGATARLAHAFQALVPDIDRQRRLLAIAQEEVAASAVGEDSGFDELWTKVESMVTSYSDANFVSRDYAQELWTAQTPVVPVEGTSDDPPDRIATWMGTVGDAALRQLDHLLLTDLLAIEQDSARWRDIAETVAAHAEDLVRVGHFDQAWALADAVIREAQSAPVRVEYLPQILQRFGHGSILKHVASYLRSADDEAFERFQRLCHAIGPPVIAPLAEALSAEQDARSRRRLRDVLVGFGAQGRDVVQQLMHAPNWEVRRTAAFLLREFGGSEGLRELIPLLTDNEPLVQREAVQALVLNGSDEAARILVNALGSITGRTRDTLVSQLLAVRDRRATPLFVYLVRTLDRGRHLPVYLAAIDALGAMGETEAVDALKQALHHSDWWAPGRTRRARGAAAAALRKIGSPAALDVLRTAAKTGSRGVRTAARSELTHVE
jgi:hypothetical protein